MCGYWFLCSKTKWKWIIVFSFYSTNKFWFFFFPNNLIQTSSFPFLFDNNIKSKFLSFFYLFIFE
jgi:hypothetical protein